MHLNFKAVLIILILIGAFAIYKYGVPFFHKWQLHRQTKQIYLSMKQGPVPWQIVGQSEKDRPIYLYEIGEKRPLTLIFGAFHGDEQISFSLVSQLAESLAVNPGLVENMAVIVPVVNPDGLLQRTRVNANGVDINRNFPTENWSAAYREDENHPGPGPASERETGLVMKLIERYQPDRIVTVHAHLRVNNFDGPARDLAEELARYNEYPVDATIGYPTPGSFGNYAGVEMNIPTVTLELPRTSPEKAWQENGKALIHLVNLPADSIQQPNLF